MTTDHPGNILQDNRSWIVHRGLVVITDQKVQIAKHYIEIILPFPPFVLPPFPQKVN